MKNWADKNYSNTFVEAVTPLIKKHSLLYVLGEQSIILHRNRFSIVVNFGSKMLNNSCIIIDKETLKDYDLNTLLLFFQHNEKISICQQPGLYSLAAIVKGLNQLSSLAPYLFEGDFEWDESLRYQSDQKVMSLDTIPQQVLLYPGVAGNSAARSRYS